MWKFNPRTSKIMEMCKESSEIMQQPSHSDEPSETGNAQEGPSSDYYEPVASTHLEHRADEGDTDADPTYEPDEAELSSDYSTGFDDVLPPQVSNSFNEPSGSFDVPKKFSRKLKHERKEKRNLGLEYQTFKGKLVKKRNRIPLKKCRAKCKDRIDDPTAQMLFSEYWALGSYDRRASFVGSCIEVVQTVRSRTRTNDPSKSKHREYTHNYCIEVRGGRVKLCKNCFLSILGESDNFLKTVTLKKRGVTSGVVALDGRGRAANPNRHSDEALEEVRAHLRSFPAYESHYTRKTNDFLYLQPHLTIDFMFKDYCSKTEKPVSMTIFNREFHNLKLKFKKPHVDTCHTCDTLKIKLQVCKDPEEKIQIQNSKDRHLDAQEMAYDEKKNDTLIAKKSHERGEGNIKCFTVDLQQCLPTPDLKTSVAFYKRQLWVYNLTIHDNVTKEVHCYMWHEGMSGRGGNQIASCMYKHLLSMPPTVTHVIFYSDTCAGQNRNSHVSSMLTFALQKIPHLQIVDQKYLVPGHTHMEADQDHSVIERKKRKSALPINHPHDWFQLVRSCGERFKVVEMMGQDFIDFAKLLSRNGPLVLRKANTDREKMTWLQVCWFRYTKNFGSILYKNTLLQEETFKELSFLRRGSFDLTSYEGEKLPYPWPISVEKKNDLKSLLGLIPDVFHSFYTSLLTSADTRDEDPDLHEFDEDA